MSFLLQVIVFLTTLTFIVATSDTSDSKPLTIEEAQLFLNNLMRDIGVKKVDDVTDSELIKEIGKYDTSKDGLLDEKEFVEYMKKNNPTFVSKAAVLFKHFDISKTGYINVNDVGRLLKAIDGNSNGIVDKDEYDWFKKVFAN